MWGLPRAAFVTIGLGLCASGVCSAPALAADPVLALTSAGQLTRFDADAPGAIPPPVTPAGLEPGDQLVAIGAENSIVQGLGSSGQVYAINLETYAAVPVASGLAPGQLTSAVGMASGPYYPQNVVLGDGTVCPLGDDGNCYVPSGVQGAGVDVLAAAAAPLTGPLSPTPSELPLYLIDGAADALMTVDEPPFGSTFRSVGPLGVPVAAPTAFAVSPDATHGLLITGQPTQTEYAVDLSTGAATPIGPLGTSAVIRSLAGIPPAAIGQTDPVTGTYDTAAELTSASASGVLAFPSPALEGRDAVITVPVNRSGDPSTTAAVAYTTIENGMPGMAVPGVDYVPVSGTIHFAPGQQYGSFSIPLLAGPAVSAKWGVDIGVSIGDTSAWGSVLVIQPGHAATPPPAAPLLGGLSATQAIGAVLTRGIRVPVTCRVACTVELTATSRTTAGTTKPGARASRAATTRVGSRLLHLTRPGTYLVHVGLTVAGRRAIRDAHRATVTLLAKARYRSGAAGSDRARLTLVARSGR
jgi:Domain of unknown function (DUF4394)